MHETDSLSPAEQALSQIETLLEQIYDQIQAVRDEASQAWFWTPEVQKQIRKAEDDIKRGNTKLFSNRDDLLTDLHAHVQN
jgi:peptidoglycan hydrolase CwlO-like protein